MKMRKKIGVIIPAAGKGKRMSNNVSKQYIEINKKPIIAYTIEKFQNSSSVDDIILIVGKGEEEYVEKYIKNRYGFTKIKAIVKGGKERQDSVYEGLKVLDNDVDIVLIHDGVRPMISNNEIERVIEETIKHKACVLGVKVKDTIKVVNEQGEVIKTPDRNHLYAIQTPQAFDRKIITDAYKKGIKENFTATDDSMFVEEFTSVKVKVIEGNDTNIKITTPNDFKIFKEYIQGISQSNAEDSVYKQ